MECSSKAAPIRGQVIFVRARYALLLSTLWVVLSPQPGGAQAVHGSPITPAPTTELVPTGDTTLPKPAATTAAAATRIPLLSTPVPTNHILAAAAEYVNADFETLASYPFDLPNGPVTTQAVITETEKQIPPTVKNWDGKKASVRGFMLPLDGKAGKTTEFLIMKNQASCCFGGMMGITDFVTVKVPGKGVEMIMDEPVTVKGTLHVGAIRDSGYIVGVYRMDGEKLVQDRAK